MTSYAFHNMLRDDNFRVELPHWLSVVALHSLMIYVIQYCMVGTTKVWA